MNPSPQAKIEFFEMRLRRKPRIVAALWQWYVKHHLTLKVNLILVLLAGIFLLVSGWQYQSNIAEERRAKDRLQNQLAALKAFERLPDKTFIMEAKNFDDYREKWRKIEHAAVAKQAEATAMEQEVKQ